MTKTWKNELEREQTIQNLTAINEAILDARKQGIVDIDCHSVSGNDYGYSVDTIKLATKLMKKWGPIIYESLSKRREAQKDPNYLKKLEKKEILKPTYW